MTEWFGGAEDLLGSDYEYGEGVTMRLTRNRRHVMVKFNDGRHGVFGMCLLLAFDNDGRVELEWVIEPFEGGAYDMAR